MVPLCDANGVAPSRSLVAKSFAYHFYFTAAYNPWERCSLEPSTQSAIRIMKSAIVKMRQTSLPCFFIPAADVNRFAGVRRQFLGHRWFHVALQESDGLAQQHGFMMDDAESSGKFPWRLFTNKTGLSKRRGI
jgi:hypothetical protein